MRLALAIGLALASLGLAALVLSNDSSIVTRGPANANASLNALWDTVKDQSADTAKLDAAARQAHMTLHREPLNSVAMSLIGTIKDREGGAKNAEALMNAAVSINHRENIADLWLFDHLLAQRRYEPAFVRADSLLRREAEFTTQLFPRLASSLNDPEAAAPLAKRLAKGPAWRNVFTEKVIQSQPDPGVLFKLFSSIKDAKGTISPEELTGLLTRLVALGRFDEAYLDWILFLPDGVTSKLSNVYDGDFDGMPDSKPFGWNFTDGASGLVEPPEDRNDPALHVLYDGMVARQFPSQLMVIPPGRYSLIGEVKSETPTSAGRMAWIVQCEGQPVVLATAPAPATGGQWRKFSTDFVVPAGCPGQRLVLKGITGDRRADINLWYDKLNVVPAGAAQ